MSRELRKGGWWLATWAALMVGVPLVRFVVMPAGAVVWTKAAYEDEPSSSAAVSEGDDRIRESRAEIRFRMEVEHFIGDDLDDDNGLHRLGSARVYMTTAEPDELNDSHSGQGSGTLTDYLNSSSAEDSGEEDLNDPASLSDAGAEDDVGHGRMWLDTDGADDSDGNADDNQFYIFEGSAGAGGGAFAAIQGQTGGSLGGDDQILAGSHNLVYNGSFSATDGTGLVAATAVPEGWAPVTSPTYTYTDPSGDIRWGDGVHVNVKNAGATNEGIQISLVGLAASSFFKVIARAIDDGSAVCTLDVTNEGGTAFSSDATTTDAWETLSGTFGTAAAIDTVEITLVTTGADTEVCGWDNVAVYQIGDPLTDRDEVDYPSGIVVLQDDSSGAADTDVANGGGWTGITGLDDLSVTPPAPGYQIDVVGQVSLTGASADNTDCLFRILELTGTTTVRTGTLTTSSAAGRVWDTQTLYWTEINPTPGTIYTYSLDVSDGAVGNDCRVDTSEGGGYLRIKMYPVH